eukprot:gene5540-4176_t
MEGPHGPNGIVIFQSLQRHVEHLAPMAPHKIAFPANSDKPSIELLVEGQTLIRPRIKKGKRKPCSDKDWGVFFSDVAAALAASAHIPFHDLTFRFQPVATFPRTQTIEEIDEAVEKVSLTVLDSSRWCALSCPECTKTDIADRSWGSTATTSSIRSNSCSTAYLCSKGRYCRDCRNSWLDHLHLDILPPETYLLETWRAVLDKLSVKSVMDASNDVKWRMLLHVLALWNKRCKELLGTSSSAAGGAVDVLQMANDGALELGLSPFLHTFHELSAASADLVGAGYPAATREEAIDSAGAREEARYLAGTREEVVDPAGTRVEARYSIGAEGQQDQWQKGRRVEVEAGGSPTHPASDADVTPGGGSHAHPGSNAEVNPMEGSPTHPVSLSRRTSYPDSHPDSHTGLPSQPVRQAEITPAGAIHSEEELPHTRSTRTTRAAKARHMQVLHKGDLTVEQHGVSTRNRLKHEEAASSAMHGVAGTRSGRQHGGGKPSSLEGGVSTRNSLKHEEAASSAMHGGACSRSGQKHGEGEASAKQEGPTPGPQTRRGQIDQLHEDEPTPAPQTRHGQQPEEASPSAMPDRQTHAEATPGREDPMPPSSIKRGLEGASVKRELEATSDMAADTDDANGGCWSKRRTGEHLGLAPPVKTSSPDQLDSALDPRKTGHPVLLEILQIMNQVSSVCAARPEPGVAGTEPGTAGAGARAEAEAAGAGARARAEAEAVRAEAKAVEEATETEAAAMQEGNSVYGDQAGVDVAEVDVAEVDVAEVDVAEGKDVVAGAGLAEFEDVLAGDDLADIEQAVRALMQMQMHYHPPPPLSTHKASKSKTPRPKVSAPSKPKNLNLNLDLNPSRLKASAPKVPKAKASAPRAPRPNDLNMNSNLDPSRPEAVVVAWRRKKRAELPGGGEDRALTGNSNLNLNSTESLNLTGMAERAAPEPRGTKRSAPDALGHISAEATAAPRDATRDATGSAPDLSPPCKIIRPMASHFSKPDELKAFKRPTRYLCTKCLLLRKHVMFKTEHSTLRTECPKLHPVEFERVVAEAIEAMAVSLGRSKKGKFNSVGYLAWVVGREGVDAFTYSECAMQFYLPAAERLASMPLPQAIMPVALPHLSFPPSAAPALPETLRPLDASAPKKRSLQAVPPVYILPDKGRKANKGRKGRGLPPTAPWRVTVPLPIPPVPLTVAQPAPAPALSAVRGASADAAADRLAQAAPPSDPQGASSDAAASPPALAALSDDDDRDDVCLSALLYSRPKATAGAASGPLALAAPPSAPSVPGATAPGPPLLASSWGCGCFLAPGPGRCPKILWWYGCCPPAPGCPFCPPKSSC